jgi:hypothetical protein
MGSPGIETTQEDTMSRHLLETLEKTDSAHDLPDEVFELPDDAVMTARGTAQVEVRLLPDGPTARVRIHLSDPLLSLMRQGAAQLVVDLLPPGADARPLDQLRWLQRDGTYSPSIEDLDQTLWTFLRVHRGPRRFGIQLVAAFSVNTRWAVATAPSMSPRGILALPAISLPFQDYSLYRPGSERELPRDEPIPIHRGDHFEAVRDGKYGTGTSSDLAP